MSDRLLGHNEGGMSMNSWKLASIVACGALLLLTGGCVSDTGGVFKRFHIDSDDEINKIQSVATGARHRVITVRKPRIESRPGLVTPYSVVCAEPSPDVATAISTSFGAGFSLFGRGGGSISGETVQGLVQLAERTASIQLMRDQMYRACEAYANGAITGTSYSLLMNQINATMITLLLGETAGGVFGRSLAAIGGKASALTNASMTGMPGAMNNIQQNTEQLAEAELGVTAAEAKVAKLKEQAKTDTGKKAEVTAAEQEVIRAKVQRDALKELLTSEITTASEAAGEIAKLVAGGGIDAEPDPAVAAQLVEMQRNFIQRSPSQSLIDACLVELGMWNVAPGVSELLTPPAKELVKKGGLSPETMPGLLIAAFKREKTGLFNFCETYLPTMAPEIYRADATTQFERISLERRELDLRWVETRADAMVGLASALAQCDRIADPGTKSSCKAAVLDLQGGEGVGPSEQVQAMQALLRRDVGKPTFPTMSYDRAKQSLSTAHTRMDELRGLNLAGIPRDISDEERSEWQAELGRLTKNRSTLITEVQTAIAAATEYIVEGDSKRPSLALMERTQIDLGNNIDLEANPFKRAISLAELQKVQAEALLEVNLYDGFVQNLNRRSSQMDVLISDFKQFGVELK